MWSTRAPFPPCNVVTCHVFSPLPNTHSVRAVSVEIFDEKALTDDQRIAYAKIAIPQSVFQVNLKRSSVDRVGAFIYTGVCLI